MEPVVDFGNLLTGLQYLPEREKIILVALINAHGMAQNGDVAKIERLVGQTIIAAARENHRGSHPETPTPEAVAPEGTPVVSRIR
jgi:hypothetical protein